MRNTSEQGKEKTILAHYNISSSAAAVSMIPLQDKDILCLPLTTIRVFQATQTNLSIPLFHLVLCLPCLLLPHLGYHSVTILDYHSVTTPWLPFCYHTLVTILLPHLGYHSVTTPWLPFCYHTLVTILLL